MTTQNVQAILNAIRKDEYIEFVTLAKQLFDNGVVKVNLQDFTDLYCNVMIFHFDDKVYNGKLFSIARNKGGDTFRYDDDEIHFDITLQDGDGELICEDVQQLCVGELTKVNEVLCEYIKMHQSNIDDNEIMFTNYKNLIDIEKLFLSEIIGNEQWFTNHKYMLSTIFNGEKAPNGDTWEKRLFP